MADYHSAAELPFDDPGLLKEINTRLALLHNEFGISFFNRSRYAEAESEFSHACKHNPSVSQFALNQGSAAYYQEKPLKAYNLYVKALELDPDNREARMKLAEYRMAQDLAPREERSSVKRRPRPGARRSRHGSSRRAEQKERVRATRSIVKQVYQNNRAIGSSTVHNILDTKKVSAALGR